MVPSAWSPIRARSSSPLPTGNVIPARWSLATKPCSVLSPWRTWISWSRPEQDRSPSIRPTRISQFRLQRDCRLGRPRKTIRANRETASMSRQDANAAFATTSFLYSGNAAYIEDLQARYETDPKSVDAQWQAFFQSLKGDAA